MTSSASTLFRPFTNDLTNTLIVLPPRRSPAFLFPAPGAIPSRRGEASIGGPQIVFDAAARTNEQEHGIRETVRW